MLHTGEKVYESLRKHTENQNPSTMQDWEPQGRVSPEKYMEESVGYLLPTTLEG